MSEYQLLAVARWAGVMQAGKKPSNSTTAAALDELHTKLAKLVASVVNGLDVETDKEVQIIALVKTGFDIGKCAGLIEAETNTARTLQSILDDIQRPKEKKIDPQPITIHMCDNCGEREGKVGIEDKWYCKPCAKQLDVMPKGKIT